MRLWHSPARPCYIAHCQARLRASVGSFKRTAWFWGPLCSGARRRWRPQQLRRPSREGLASLGSLAFTSARGLHGGPFGHCAALLCAQNHGSTRRPSFAPREPWEAHLPDPMTDKCRIPRCSGKRGIVTRPVREEGHFTPALASSRRDAGPRGPAGH